MKVSLSSKYIFLIGIGIAMLLLSGCTLDDSKWDINLNTTSSENTMPTLSPEELNSKANDIANYIVSSSKAEEIRIKDVDDYIQSRLQLEKE